MLGGHFSLRRHKILVIPFRAIGVIVIAQKSMNFKVNNMLPVFKKIMPENSPIS